ncbi:MAG TPA: hypothetical protein VLF18_15980 [Tahibacter sp.]|uniref:hypothetical protein n=1 Tax=Tahibacter sp. TaxID=2056211 RepID=UPI002B6F1253|nr:hypothetical protein [Tahibacter sp.]HSX61692.1 hypothetical protein [Tahibacter sp.]
MRFVWLLLMIASIAFAIMTRSPGMLALALFVAFVSGLCTVFTFAAARIESTSRPDSALLTPEVLAAVRARGAQQRAAAGQPQAPPSLPPARPAAPPQPPRQ